MLSSLPTSFPDIHGVLWYDVTSSGPGGYSDWPIESSSSAQAAFASGISNPVFATNTFANTGTGTPVPIP
jgi:hypothetical protein